MADRTRGRGAATLPGRPAAAGEVDVAAASAALAGSVAPPGRGTLYVVATPIGNLGDITLRAIDVLRSVAVVAAEDTRLTLRLWARHGITTHLVSYHAQSAPARVVELVARLAAGDDVAIVTDAGTPLVSDPGEGLVGAWAAAGGTIVPIPGPSAVLAALVASGIAAPRWAFEGFLPRKGAERRERMARIAADERATVLFEAPGRTAATLGDLAVACGADRAAAVCRELTKRHEEICRGPLGELASSAATQGMRGEVTIVVAGAPPGPAAIAPARTLAGVPGPTGLGPPSAAEALVSGRAQVAALVATGMPRAAAAREIARASGLSRRALYGHDAER